MLVDFSMKQMKLWMRNWHLKRSSKRPKRLLSARLSEMKTDIKVCISSRSQEGQDLEGYIKLHLVNGCHVHAEKCQQTVILNSLDNALFDAACKVCKSKLKALASDPEDSSSSSGGSSSSTQSSERVSDNEELGF